MASVLLVVVLAASVVLAAALPGASAGELHQLGVAGWVPSRPACTGSVAECLGEEEEFALDSESGRRVLAGTSGYISYGALRPDTVPCSIPGNSYYSNCRAGAAVNPYTRPCSQIYRCRS